MYVTTTCGGKKLNSGFWDTYEHGTTPVLGCVKCRNLMDKQNDYYLPKKE